MSATRKMFNLGKNRLKPHKFCLINMIEFVLSHKIPMKSIEVCYNVTKKKIHKMGACKWILFQGLQVTNAIQITDLKCENIFLNHTTYLTTIMH